MTQVDTCVVYFFYSLNIKKDRTDIKMESTQHQCYVYEVNKLINKCNVIFVL